MATNSSSRARPALALALLIAACGGRDGLPLQPSIGLRAHVIPEAEVGCVCARGPCHVPAFAWAALIGVTLGPMVRPSAADEAMIVASLGIRLEQAGRSAGASGSLPPSLRRVEQESWLDAQGSWSTRAYFRLPPMEPGLELDVVATAVDARSPDRSPLVSAPVRLVIGAGPPSPPEHRSPEDETCAEAARVVALLHTPCPHRAVSSADGLLAAVLSDPGAKDSQKAVAWMAVCRVADAMGDGDRARMADAEVARLGGDVPIRATLLQPRPRGAGCD